MPRRRREHAGRTGRPVAVAFDAGNLERVARALRKAHPAALLVIAGDDDRATATKTGRNPGREKAQAAARAVRGVVVLPELPAGAGSDFNDMHQASGLDAVRERIEGAIADALQARQGRARGEAGHTPSDESERAAAGARAGRRGRRDFRAGQSR